MTLLRQILSVTAMNVRTLPQRVASSVVVVVGIAGVVGVLVSVLAMSHGLRNALLSTAQPDRAIVMGEGTTNEGGSALAVDAVQAVLDAPGIARLPEGGPAASPEMFVAVNMNRKEDGARSGVVVRGLAPAGLAIRPEIRLVEGRWFRAGLRELVVGRAVQTEFSGLEIGDRVMLRDGEWTVVGTFESGGTANEGTLLADVDTLLSAYGRTVYNSVRVRLESEAAFDAFRDALTTNLQLAVNVLREPDYYAQAQQGIGTLFSVITGVVGSIMAVGALFAALNTMYAAVSSRAVEIATLRAIGFGAGGVVVSVLVEALLLALVGALLGAGVAALLFNGNTVSLGGNGGSIVAQMAVTPAVMAAAGAWAGAVGLLGGLFPAIRAARLPVATALRAV
ncbi:MAG TPA: ABC transporter permease [Gammaproteobacteria bacterium]